MATVNEFWPSIFFHPGEGLAEKLGELKMEAEEFAYRTGTGRKGNPVRPAVRKPCHPGDGIRFEGVLGIPSYMWLGKQASYDRYMARKRETAKNLFTIFFGDSNSCAKAT